MTEMEERKLQNIGVKVKKIAIGIVIGLGVGIFTLIALFFVLIVLFLYGGPTQRVKGADRYEKTIHKYTQEVVEKVHTGFYCFPVKIPESAFSDGKEPTFYFSYKNTWDDPTCEVYLECEYSKEDYENELARLRGKISADINHSQIDKYLKYEENGRFKNPVYIAIDRDDHDYEYAMDLGNNRIAYIYTSFKDSKARIKKIPHEYLPDDYDESFMNVKAGERFNIYISYKSRIMDSTSTKFNYGQ